VSIAGTSLGELGETALTRLRRDRVGFIFQAFNLVSSLSAAQNVALPLRLAGRRPADGEVAAALAEVGLADRARHRPSELSGGQQQRVAIARALITRPAVVFADEPTGALDNSTSRQVLGLLRALVDEHGQTIVMVTHDPVAAAVADRVLLLADGRFAGELTEVDAGAIAARMTTLEAAC
jgi:putative ABC transport system ATP-binding protein